MQGKASRSGSAFQTSYDLDSGTLTIDFPDVARAAALVIDR